MSALLDFPGLAAAFILTLLIVIPVLLRTLRQEKTAAERMEKPGEQPLSTPPVTALECRHCGQMNRVPLDAARALCGKCKGELIAVTPAVK